MKDMNIIFPLIPLSFLWVKWFGYSFRHSVVHFYSGPPLLTTEHCSFLLFFFCSNLLALSLLRNASKQKQMSSSVRCYFADLFALLFWRQAGQLSTTNNSISLPSLKGCWIFLGFEVKKIECIRNSHCFSHSFPRQIFWVHLLHCRHAIQKKIKISSLRRKQGADDS